MKAGVHLASKFVSPAMQKSVGDEKREKSALASKFWSGMKLDLQNEPTRPAPSH